MPLKVNLSVRGKIIALTTAAITLSVAALLLTANLTLRSTLSEEQGAALSRRSADVLDALVARVEKEHTLLETVALSPVVREAAESANARNAALSPDARRKRIDEIDAEWQAGAASADALARAVQENTAADFLRSVQTQFPDLVEVFLTDEAGANVAMTGRTGDYNQADEAWWQQTFAEGKGGLYVGKVERDASSGAYALNLGVPVFDRKGRVGGVLRGTVDVSLLATLLGETAIGETGYAVLIDQDDQILYHPNEALRMKAAPAELLETLAQGAWSADARALDGTPVVMASARSEEGLAGALGWRVVLMQSRAEVFSGLFTLLRFLMIVAVVVAAAALLVSVFLAGRLTKPIERLAEAARDVAEGRLDVHVDESSSDEIGRLAGTFNGMVARVRSALTDAEQGREAAAAAAHEAEAQKERALHDQGYLSRSVATILREMDAFSAGDLTVRLPVEQDDEIGRLFKGFNGAVENMGRTIAELNGAVEAAASAAMQISSAAEELAAGTQEQSAQAGEVAAAVEEMTRTIVDNSRSATEASAVAQSSGAVAADGGRVVGATVAKIEEIAAVVTRAAATVERLGASSERIGEITAVINGIADQTNLLALNAAIEAARAGEHGRGFAVVADEVRKLAERTSTATRQISDMIHSIQHETGEAVGAMARGSVEVGEGIRLAGEARGSLERMVAESQSVVDRVTQIAAASEEQSATSEQIARSVEAIAAVSNQGAAGVSQVAEAATDLSRLTADLRALVAGFHLETSVRRPLPSGDGAARPAQLRGW